MAITQEGRVQKDKANEEAWVDTENEE